MLILKIRERFHIFYCEIGILFCFPPYFFPLKAFLAFYVLSNITEFNLANEDDL